MWYFAKSANLALGKLYTKDKNFIKLSMRQFRRQTESNPKTNGGRSSGINQPMVRTNSNPTDSNWRQLVNPVLFTIGFGGVAFSGAAIWQYENLREALKKRKSSFDDLLQAIRPEPKIPKVHNDDTVNLRLLEILCFLSFSGRKLETRPQQLLEQPYRWAKSLCSHFGSECSSFCYVENSITDTNDDTVILLQSCTQNGQLSANVTQCFQSLQSVALGS
jgi:hypothetical protein